MNIKDDLIPHAIVFKSHVNKYTFLGLAISITSIVIASLIVSYQLTGYITLYGFILAQKTNPAIWVLDLTPFVFGYWGQAFFQGLVSRAQTILGETTKEFKNLSNQLENALRQEIYYDYLTNLPNSRMYTLQLTQSIEKLDKRGELAVIIIKINDFMNINYNFGTFNANTILKQFTDNLNSILMDSYLLQETIGINLVARLQNDEFALLLSQLKKNIDVDELLTNIRKLINVNFMIDGISINITTSIGVAIYPYHGDKDEILINHAGIALFHARKESKPYVVYNKMMEDFVLNRVVITELKNAIENDELEIHYLPVVELATGHIVGAESLVRFEHPQYGLMTADKFIPLIEGTSLIQALTAFMLKGVIRQLALWHSEGYIISVSVNLSNRDISNRELPALLERLLSAQKISPEYLKLEFTERACLTNQVITKSVLEQLSALGVKLSIDDFCSGFSSFTYLTNFPIDDVKIEKSYVWSMIKDTKKSKIVESIIKLGEVLDIGIIADGIKDQATVDKLKSLGCVYGLGFFFSQPLNVDDFNDLLKQKKGKKTQLLDVAKIQSHE